MQPTAAASIETRQSSLFSRLVTCPGAAKQEVIGPRKDSLLNLLRRVERRLRSSSIVDRCIKTHQTQVFHAVCVPCLSCLSLFTWLLLYFRQVMRIHSLHFPSLHRSFSAYLTYGIFVAQSVKQKQEETDDNDWPATSKFQLSESFVPSKSFPSLFLGLFAALYKLPPFPSMS